MVAKAIPVAVIIPCHNEGPAIGQVVESFRTALPGCTIYVYDNNSDDDTAARAEAAGAVVRREYRQGKGHVIRRAFADVEAEVYVMVDGDGTYDAGAASDMVERLRRERLDMVVGARIEDHAAAYRRGHRLGNRLLTRAISLLFENQFDDVLSGYRVFSRRFAKSFPGLASGFEIEVMLAIHALELRMPCCEQPTRYSERIRGTISKLSTWRDGLRILLTIAGLFKDVRPFLFFGILTILFATLSVGLALPVVIEFLHTGLVPRFPTAILATGMMLAAGIFFTCGLILDSVSKGRLEQKRLIYLSMKRGVDE